MAVVEKRDVPLKRATVQDWHDEYAGLTPQPQLDLWLADKVQAEGYEDMQVNMGEQLGPVSLVDVLLMEWESYG